MYERTHNLNRLYIPKNNKINNKLHYTNNKSSLFNYNKNLNYIKGDRGIYSLLKEKMKFQNLKNHTNSFNYQNITSNNSHRNSSYLNNHQKKSITNIRKVNKISNIINHNTIHTSNINFNKNNLYASTINEFRKNKENNLINYRRKNSVNNISDIDSIKNCFSDIKKNKFDEILEGLKTEFETNDQYKINNDKNNIVLYNSRNNIIKKDNHRNNSSNINKKISNFVLITNNNNNNINNYLSTINNHNYRKINNKITFNNNLNKSYMNINKTINNNNNYLPLKTYDNKNEDFSFLNNNQNNYIYNNIIEFKNNIYKDKNKTSNFLFTQNNINNYYILNTCDNKENYYRQNMISNKKYHSSTNNIYKRKIKNNLYSDLLHKDKKPSKDFAKYIPLNLEKNFNLKRKNSSSIFEHNNNRKNGVFSNYNYYNILDNYKKKYDNGIKESYVGSTDIKIMNYQISQNDDEDSIDINNIDNSSILIDNIK